MTAGDPGAMQPGRQFGSYTIQSLIGAGGMGEVYRARDSKLGRDVALKVLPVSLAGDVDRLSRFEREALLLASLSHPNIAIIHGLEEVAGIRALVLELIEGPTLAERIAPGPIPLDETLAIARQIADALQSAHDNGVIHRDLKPANIKVRRDGTVKVLDFGLAKLTGQLACTDGPRLSNSPTMVSSMPGLLLGTAAYMSPEQAKGQEADRRSDVWAFGCVLFEMLTGRAAFAGHSSTEVFANVLKTDPDWSRLPTGTPDAIRRLLRRCLEKDDKRRVWDIADARLELDEARDESLAPRPLARGHRAERLAWGSAVAGLALLAAMIGVRSVRPAPVGPEVRFDINTPPVADPEDFLSVAISPDGQTLLFVANSEGQPYLWVRPLDSVVARPLPGTANPMLPFWSPDSRSVCFFADGQLKRLDLDGGLVRMLTQATFGRGGAWNRDGVILFAPNPAGPIFRVPSDGGTPVRVTSLEASHSGHGMPSFLPDGRHFLYIAAGTADSRGVYVGQLDGPPARKLVDDADMAATYAAGHLLFVRHATVFAQDFDADRLEVRGSPFPVVEGVTAGNNSGSLSASVGGTIAVRVGLARARRQLAWFDRSGKEMETLGDIGSVSRAGFSPSPDGGQLAFIRRVETNPDIWLLETRRNLRTRFTFHPGEDIFPAWSRDGSRIVFSSNRDGGFSLYQKQTSGNGPDELVLPGTPEETFASDTSPDGRLLLFQRRSVKTGWDVWSMPLGGAGQPERVVQTEFDERDALLSPDGKWLAYFANNSGHFEVYVQPFPAPGLRQQVSTSGGVQMRWRPDGRELFYLALDRTLMAVPMQTAADGKSLTVGTPLPLFAARVGGLINPGPGAEYIVSADGKRFLMNTLVQESDANPIRLIVNWKARP